MSATNHATYLETEEDPLALMARLLRRQGLPMAARWWAADSYATLHIDAEGRVTSDDYCGEQGPFLEDLSALALAHLWQHGVRGEQAEELRQEIERYRQEYTNSY